MNADFMAAGPTEDIWTKTMDFLNMPDRVIPKSTLSQHFRILREAGLIRSERSGVALKNTPRCQELQPRFGRMIAEILAAYAQEYGRKDADE